MQIQIYILMEEDQMLDKNEATEFLKVSVATLNRWMKENLVSYIKIDRKVLFQKSQLVQDLKAFQVDRK